MSLLEKVDYVEAELRVRQAAARCVEIARMHGARATAAKIRTEFMLGVHICNDCGEEVEFHVGACVKCHERQLMREQEGRLP